MKDLGPNEWRGSAEVIEDPAIKVQAFVVEERPNYHQGFLWCANTKEKKKKKLSAFRDSSIYVMFINISERGR